MISHCWQVVAAIYGTGAVSLRVSKPATNLEMAGQPTRTLFYSLSNQDIVDLDQKPGDGLYVGGGRAACGLPSACMGQRLLRELPRRER